MILKCETEFRGKSERQNEKGVYRFVNLEDIDGESAKFQINDNVDISKLKKGDKVVATFDYNLKYGSLKVVEIIGK